MRVIEAVEKRAKGNPRGKYEEDGKRVEYFGYAANVNCERRFRAYIQQWLLFQAQTDWQWGKNSGRLATCRRKSLLLVRRKVFHCVDCGQLPLPYEVARIHISTARNRLVSSFELLLFLMFQINFEKGVKFSSSVYWQIFEKDVLLRLSEPFGSRYLHSKQGSCTLGHFDGALVHKAISVDFLRSHVDLHQALYYLIPDMSHIYWAMFHVSHK